MGVPSDENPNLYVIDDKFGFSYYFEYPCAHKGRPFGAKSKIGRYLGNSPHIVKRVCTINEDGSESDRTITLGGRHRIEIRSGERITDTV